MRLGRWMTSCLEAWAEIWEEQLVEFLLSNERVEIQSWARPEEFVCYGRRALVGLRIDDVKVVSIERLCVSLSSCRKTFKLKKFPTFKPLNSKGFVPEPISCFRIPIYVYEHSMNIMSFSHIRIMGMLQPLHITGGTLQYFRPLHTTGSTLLYIKRTAAYHRWDKDMDTAIRVLFLYKTDCISHSTNTLGKGMNPIILPPSMGK